MLRELEGAGRFGVLPLQYPLPLGELKPLLARGKVGLDPAGPAWYRDYLRYEGGLEVGPPGEVRPEYLVLMGLHRLRWATVPELSAQLPAGPDYGDLRGLLKGFAAAGLVRFDRVSGSLGLTPDGRSYLRAVHGLDAGGLSRVGERFPGRPRHQHLCRVGIARALGREGFRPLLCWSFPKLGKGYSFPDGLAVAEDGEGREWVFLVEVERRAPDSGERHRRRFVRRQAELMRLSLGRPWAVIYLVAPGRVGSYRRLFELVGFGPKVLVWAYG